MIPAGMVIVAKVTKMCLQTGHQGTQRSKLIMRHLDR